MASDIGGIRSVLRCGPQPIVGAEARRRLCRLAGNALRCAVIESAVVTWRWPAEVADVCACLLRRTGRGGSPLGSDNLFDPVQFVQVRVGDEQKVDRHVGVSAVSEGPNRCGDILDGGVRGEVHSDISVDVAWSSTSRYSRVINDPSVTGEAFEVDRTRQRHHGQPAIGALSDAAQRGRSECAQIDRGMGLAGGFQADPGRRYRPPGSLVDNGLVGGPRRREYIEEFVELRTAIGEWGSGGLVFLR